MPPPSENPQAWIALVRAHPIAWRKIVADALKPRPSGQNGQTHEPPASDHYPCGPPASPWLCYNCGASFTTRRGLASHATHAHKRAGAASDCMHGTNCVACLREFHTRHRLTAHLIHGSPACAEAIRRHLAPPSPLDVQELLATERACAAQAKANPGKYLPHNKPMCRLAGPLPLWAPGSS